jgi:phenylacetate-coenzyme A ligase PaaK-like adenylate-forming protein
VVLLHSQLGKKWKPENELKGEKIMSENILSLLRDVRRVRKQGLDAIKQRQHERLADIVSFARVNSPYYRELYQGLTERVTDPTLLPVTDKKKLMARFDDWSTDSQVTLEKVRPFIENPDLFGKQFLGKYLVITTSGTTGTHGLFLVDRHSLSVIGPLFLSMLSDWLTPREVRRFIRSGGRIGLVLASGTPTATGVSITHFASRLGKSLRALSVRAPLPELVAGLNEFQPAFVISYGTVMKLLASEQEAGCLQIKPVMALVTAEGLALDEYDHIAEVFNTKVGTSMHPLSVLS